MVFGMQKQKRIAEAEEKKERRAKKDILSYLPKATDLEDCTSKKSLKRKMKIPLEEEVDEETFEEARQAVKAERKLIQKAERRVMVDRAKSNPLLRPDRFMKRLDPEGQRHRQFHMNYPKQKVWVKNLAEEVNEEMLAKHFEGVGETLRVEICKKRQWGIVVFHSEKATPHALKLNGSELAGQKVEVLLFSDEDEEEIFNLADPTQQVLFCNFPMTCRLQHVRPFVKSFGFITRCVVPQHDGTKGPKCISQGKAYVTYLTETGMKNALAQHGTFCHQESGSLMLKPCDAPEGFEKAPVKRKKGETPAYPEKKGDGYCRVLVVRRKKMTAPAQVHGLKWKPNAGLKPGEVSRNGRRYLRKLEKKKAAKAAEDQEMEAPTGAESQKKKQKKGEEEEAAEKEDEEMEGGDDDDDDE